MQLNADDIEEFVIEFTNKERVRATLSEFVTTKPYLPSRGHIARTWL